MNNLVQPPYRRAFGALGREASRAFDRLSHAVEWHQTGTMMSTAKAPYRLVHQDVDLSIMHFRSSQALVHSTPVLLIPPLGVTPEIYDLRPEHSFVRALLNAGLDLYMIDFGVPDLSDRQKALTDYAMRLLPQAIDITLTDSGTPSLSLVGYSMGGVMALLYAGDEGKTAPVDALVTVGSPIDMRGLFPWDRVISLARRELDAVVATFGVLPPQLMRLGFRLSAPFKTVTVYRDLMVNMWNREWIVSYEAINSWIDTFIPFPGDAMRQFFHFIEGNRIVEGTIPSRSGEFSLARIEQPLLCIAGTSDSIVPERAVERTIELVSSSEKRYVSVPGGHIGIIGGSRASSTTWKEIGDWLPGLSGPLRAPRPFGASA